MGSRRRNSGVFCRISWEPRISDGLHYVGRLGKPDDVHVVWKYGLAGEQRHLSGWQSQSWRSLERIKDEKIACALLACCALFGILPESIAQNVAPGGSDLILVRPTEKSPEAVVEAIKAYAEGKKWAYIGAYKVKSPQGEVTLVKVCVFQRSVS